MRVTVVIPTHNRPASLERTLQALDGQTLPRSEFEVVVVDDGSGPEARAAVRALGKRFDFERIEQPPSGLAAARNAGARKARGSLLYFLDDDVEPAPGAVAEHVKSHEAAQGAAAVIGALPYPDSIRLTPFLWYLERCTHYDLYKDPHKYPEGRPPLPPLNGNSSLSRETFFSAGAYDEGFRQYGGEDLDFGYRLARCGVRFVYNPRAVGYHHHVKSFAQFCADMERAGESLIRIYRKYPEIKTAKKIDVLVDPLRSLPWSKKLMRAVLTVSLGAPWLLGAARTLIAVGERWYALRAPLFPLYRWVAHTHYALGMRRGLAAAP